MAKTYVSAVKYNILQKFEIKGLVDKPDIIGAIFGQSEGLVGEDLDLRELQKNGKIGRIEIKSSQSKGKTRGELLISSSLDRVETSVLAAAIESIEKVGPCEARFSTENIEDARSEKRKHITERAKELLQRMMDEEIPESRELTDTVRDDVKTADLVNYGGDKLPAGPDVEGSEELILVEGRADVLNLLKNNVRNVIGVNGANVSRTILELCKRKNTTLFVDGDRGGEIIAKQLQQLTKIDFIARAPDGKEVEELTKKEIVMALRKKVPAERGFYQSYQRREPPAFERSRGRGFNLGYRERGGFERGRGFDRPSSGRGFGMGPRGNFERGGRGSFERRGTGRGFPSARFQGRRERFDREAGMFPGERHEPIQISFPASAEDQEVFSPIISQLKGSLEGIIFDEGLKEVKRVKVRNLLIELFETKGVHTVVFDGIITKRLVDEAKAAGVKVLVGVKKGKIGEEKDIKIVEIKG